MSDWVVVVPSAGRAETLAAKTLPALARGRVPASRVTVVVPSAEEADEYRAALDPDTYRDVVVVEHDPTHAGIDEVGIRPFSLGRARNGILDLVPAGVRLVQVDDDVAGLIRRTGEQTAEPVADVAGFLDASFGLAETLGVDLWGVYPVRNPYFMRERLRVGLTYICGGLFGLVVRHRPYERVVLDEKEDFERSIRYADGGPGAFRWENVGLLTQGYAGAGGMQLSRTPERVLVASQWLASSFPDACRLNLSKRSGRAEVRLNGRRSRTVPLPEALVDLR